MKPVGRSQGSGIFLVTKLAQIQQWRPATPWVVGSGGGGGGNRGSTKDPDDDEQDKTENYVVQKYVEGPMLVGGKKFDMRMYVAVTSYQ